MVNISPQHRLKDETKRSESYLRFLKFCLSDRGTLMVSLRRSITYGYENYTPFGVKIEKQKFH
jgi:hypothetical protein